MKFKFKKSGAVRVSSISFLYEQQGHPEAELKQRISEHLAAELTVSCAFLLRVKYGNSEEEHVALCICDNGLNQQGLQKHIVEIFRKMFNTEQSLDIIFLRPDQAQKALQAGRPFYVRRAGISDLADF